MQRKNFFKSLIALVAAPSVLGEIDFDKNKSVGSIIDPFQNKEILFHWKTIYYYEDSEKSYFTQLSNKGIIPIEDFYKKQTTLT